MTKFDDKIPTIAISLLNFNSVIHSNNYTSHKNAHCVMCIMYIQYTILPKTKKFGSVGRGDLTSLFKSCEIDRSRGDLSSNAGNKKSFTSRPSGL